MFITFDEYLKESLDFEHNYKFLRKENNISKRYYGDDVTHIVGNNYYWDTGMGDVLNVLLKITDINKLKKENHKDAINEIKYFKRRYDDLPENYDISYVIYVSFSFENANYNKIENGEPTFLKNLGAVKESIFMLLNQIGVSEYNLPPNIYLESSALWDSAKEAPDLNSNRRFRIYKAAINKLYKNSELFFVFPNDARTDILVKIT